MYYYLSIGTNLSPEINAVRVARALCKRFGRVIIYPFCETKPEGIKSDNMFLNSLALIQTDKSYHDLKVILNSIESDLGRNKKDPLSGKKDRTADIDILDCSNEIDFSIFKKQKDQYIRSVLNADLIVNLRPYGLPVEHGATTIDFDRASSQIIIIEDKINSL